MVSTPPSLPHFYLLALLYILFSCFLLFLTFKCSDSWREGRKERKSEWEKSWWVSLVVIQHEAPCWVEFSCAADSWITRQSIHGSLESGDNLGLINLGQGLWCHIVKSMMTYLLLIASVRAMCWQQWKASWVGRMAGRPGTCVPPSKRRVPCYGPGKVFKCVVYWSTKVNLCKFKDLALPNWDGLNVGKAECEAGSLWESHSAFLSDFSFLQRHFQVGCNCLPVDTLYAHKSSLAQKSKLCCVWELFG